MLSEAKSRHVGRKLAVEAFVTLPIDEFNLSIIPIALQKGPRIFEGFDLNSIHLTLKATKIFSHGVVGLAYVPYHK